MTENTGVTAWDNEDAYVIVYGTHNPVVAGEKYRAYLAECGFKPGDEEYVPEADDPEFYEGMQRLWTDPKDDEQPFDTFAEPGEGREPYMVGSLG